ncbi:MAG: sulfotransferase [Burkholderiaceae bacterium]|nr:sulfotransferase [Burkholderiaceae bacterium]
MKPSVRDTLLQAVERHRAGDLAAAEKLYLKVLRADPNQADANHNMGTLARQAGRNADALPYLALAARVNPAHAPYALAYAETLNNCDRPEQAITVLEAALGRGQDSPLLQDLLASARRNAAGAAAWHGIANDAERAQVNALYRGGRFAELEPILEDLLAHHPHAGAAWKLYAICLVRLGKDARAALERTTALLPDDAEAQRNLARYLMKSGAWLPAYAAAQRLFQLEPDIATDHAMAGHAAAELGRLHDAIGHYRRALELDPSLLDVHNNLGNALKDAGQLNEAEASYRNAIALKADCAEAWCNLGLLYKFMLRPTESVEACAKALEANPELAGALILAGDLAIDDGRFAEAEQLFRAAITRLPGSPEAWAGIARTRKMTDEDRDWARAAEQLAASGLPPQLESYLRFSLGKYHDDTRQYDEAFRQFHRANELTKQVWRSRGQPDYVEAAQRDFIDAIIAHFDSAGIDRPRFAHPSARPVFIVGMPRSGTSLAEQILASHPEVHGAGELPIWGEAMKHYWAALQEGADTGLQLVDTAPQILKQLHALAPQAKRIVDKLPNNFLHVGLIHAVFPNARIIHMRRNPVDVCLSIYFNSFSDSQRYASDLHSLAHYYREYQRLMAHWRSVLPDGNLLEVPYEALVQDQETWSRKLIDFIGLPWDESCLNFHENARAVRTPSNWQVRQKISTSSVERWRNYEQFVGPLKGLLASGL